MTNLSNTIGEFSMEAIFKELLSDDVLLIGFEKFEQKASKHQELHPGSIFAFVSGISAMIEAVRST